MYIYGLFGGVVAKTLAEGELRMWERPPRDGSDYLTDAQINHKYGRRELRIVTESNRELLPNFVEAFRRKEWMTIRPFYQRRPRWDKVRQSKLIESFIMNIPIPPLFVYESDLAKYEVMDGQQRISAILDFYSDKLILHGLEQWPELNGRYYSSLPSEIRRGIDRRSISYIVLLKESAPSSEEEMLLRQQVFERLNTGGIALSNQEIRNSLYQSPFSELLNELAERPDFRAVWEIPDLHPDEDGRIPDALVRNRLFSTMRDAEIVLRFFALRQAEFYRAGMKSFLDEYMLRARNFDYGDIRYLKCLFVDTFRTAELIYGERLFRAWDRLTQTWSRRPQIALADAVMVAFSRFLDRSETLIERREIMLTATQDALSIAPYGAFTGLRNSRADVQARIELLEQAIEFTLR